MYAHVCVYMFASFYICLCACLSCCLIRWGFYSALFIAASDMQRMCPTQRKHFNKLPLWNDWKNEVNITIVCTWNTFYLWLWMSTWRVTEWEHTSQYLRPFGLYFQRKSSLFYFSYVARIITLHYRHDFSASH